MKLFYIALFLFQLCLVLTVSKYHYQSKQKEKVEIKKKLFPITETLNQKSRKGKLRILPGILKMRFKGTIGKTSIQTQSSVKEGGGGKALRGWMKFVEVDPMGPKVMSFYVNNNFFDQEKKEDADDYGPISIPDQFHFFFVVTNEYIMILSSRSQQISRAVQSLPIRKLMPQRETLKGGVEDIGDFKEGFCFKLSFIIDGKKEFIVCADDQEVKAKWMGQLATAKITADLMAKNVESNMQGGEPVAEGEAVVPGGDKKEEGKEEGKDAAKEDKPAEGEAKPADGAAAEGEAKPVDGKWIEMQDWSSCTQACGGGTQSLHRMCEPPKNKGKECEGDGVLTRPCNEQPCKVPGAEGAGEGEGGLPPGATGKEKITTNEAMVKMIRVSDVPQVYERCLMKDTDIDVVQTQLAQFQVKPRLPGRAIMNNRTLTVYMRKNIGSAVFSVPLNHIQVDEYKEDPECWKVTDKATSKSIVLCGLRSAKEPIMLIKEQWLHDMNFFKTNCFKDLEKVSLDEMNGANDPLLDLKQDELNDAKKAAAQNTAGSPGRVVDQGEIKQKFKEMQNVAIEALQKELRYEDLIESEEKQKEKDEEVELALKLEKLHNKKECLDNGAEKEGMKELEEQKSSSITAQLDEMKDQIKNMILKKRQNKLKQLEKMNRFSGRKKKDMLGKIQQARMEVAADVMKAHRKGDMGKCLSKDQKVICQYCEAAYKEDASQMIECKNEENYCFMCCENEFGGYHQKEKQKCLDQCDCDSGKGNWVWVPSNNQVKL